jgi:tetratricopeptide (TPR) repeat protein
MVSEDGVPQRRAGSSRNRWVPLAAVAVTLAMRAIYLNQIQGNPFFDNLVMDEAYHDMWAREIAAGDLASRIPFFRAPLYPYLLGLIYALIGSEEPSLLLVRGLQLMLAALTPVLVYLIARRLVPGQPWVAAAAALVTALDGVLIYFEADLLLESLLALLSTAFVLALMRAVTTGARVHWLIAGVVLGAFAITRPNILLYAPVAFVIALGWLGRRPGPRRAGLGPALALTAGTCLLVLPVTWINWSIGHDRVLVASQAGLNFFLGNNPEADGWSATAPSVIRVDWWGGYQDAITIAEDEMGRSLKPSQVSRYWFGRACRFWREQPLAAITLTLRKGIYLLSGFELSNNRHIVLFLREYGTIAYPSLALMFAVIPLAVAGAVWLWRDRDLQARALILLVVVYGFSVVLFFVTARYRVPLRPLLIILAVAGCHRIAVALRDRPRSGLTVTAAVVALGLAVNLNPWVLENQPSDAWFYQSVASIYYDQQQIEQAIRYQQRALELDPDYPKGNHLLGSMYLAAGHLQGALAAFDRARTLDPDDGHTLAALGQTLFRLGRFSEAEQCYAEAVMRLPEETAVAYNHGIVLERLGRPAAAEAEYRRVLAIDPEHAGTWAVLGRVLAAQQRLDEATACWQQARDIDPVQPLAAQALQQSR